MELTRAPWQARIGHTMSTVSFLLLQTSKTAAVAPESAGPFRGSPIVWILAGALALVAVYFVIRLLEWDLINEETPNQDDPLLK